MQPSGQTFMLSSIYKLFSLGSRTSVSPCIHLRKNFRRGVGSGATRKADYKTEAEFSGGLL